jgi:HD domain
MGFMEVRADHTQAVGGSFELPVRRAVVKRKRIAVLLIVASLAGLVPAYVWIAPPSHWHRWGLLLGLLGLAGCTALGEAALKQAVPVRFHSSAVVMVLVLLVGGPLPALIAWLLPDLVARLGLRRDRLLTPGLAANVASYGCCVLAGAGLLDLIHPGSLALVIGPTAVLVGLVQETVNFGIARGLYGTLFQGYRLRALIREEFVGVIGAELGMLAFAGICAALLAPLGTLALVLVAPAVLIPELLLPLLARSQSVAGLDRQAATRLYVAALATHLGVRPRERRTALTAIPLLTDHRRVPIGADRRLIRDAQLAAWHVTERWDGNGGPAGFASGRIPHASRLLAVAAEWAKLTAAGGPMVPQREAILALEMQSATRLDPTIVVAAGEIVQTEAMFAELDSFQPKLHALHLPRSVRLQVLPSALAAYRSP